MLKSTRKGQENVKATVEIASPRAPHKKSKKGEKVIARITLLPKGKPAHGTLRTLVKESWNL